MTSAENSLNWFEISVADLDRAKKFYETIFGIKMEVQRMMSMDMASFPYDPMQFKVAGALVKSEYHTPSMDGVKVYLNGNPDLQSVLDKVEAAGGNIIMPKTQISPEVGYMAFIMDTEQNNIGLHSNN
jgi:predicted enzyme related to lactoylglutathione lyase